jgi:large subunit ribosomal protein L22
MQAVLKSIIRYGVRKAASSSDLLRGKSVDEAFAMLSILRSRRKVRVIVEGALKSAVANLRNSEAGASIGTDKLSIKSIMPMVVQL